MTATQTLIYPLPGQYQDKPFNLGRPNIGAEFCQAVACAFDADAEDVNAVDVYWGGEYDDENSTEIVIVAGEIVGSIDPISRADWAALVAVADNMARAGAAAPKFS